MYEKIYKKVKLLRELVIISSRNFYFYILLENEEVIEVRLDKKNKTNSVGSIFKGKVKKLLPHMNAAFIDIGEKKEAFLPLKDHLECCQKLKVGDEPLLQLRRASIQSKGAKLSCKITLPGKYLVLMPTIDYISVSTKLDEETKKLLKKRIYEIIQPFNEEDKFGYIIRTKAINATDEEIIQDFQALKQQWNNIVKRYHKVNAPALLYEEGLRAYAFLRDYAGDIQKIYTNDKYLAEQLEDYIRLNFNKSDIKVIYVSENKESLFEKYNVERLINRILNPYVWLKTGGYLIIEETEALVAIDVNSGSLKKYKTLEETALHTNLEAAKEIVKQIRLRDLGGIIVVDFIDMYLEEYKEKLIKVLEEEIKKDKQTIKIKSFTSLGLLELTRKKADKSLIKQFSEVCQHCEGSGYNKGKDIVLFEIENKIKSLKPFFKLKIFINKALEKDIKSLIKDLSLENEVEIVINKNLKQFEYRIEKF